MEQELWQKEDKGVIGILPVRDATDTMAIGPPVLSSGDHEFSDSIQIVEVIVFNKVLPLNTAPGLDLGDRNPKSQVGVSDSHKINGKTQQEVIQWHTRYNSCI